MGPCNLIIIAFFFFFFNTTEGAPKPWGCASIHHLRKRKEGSQNEEKIVIQNYQSSYPSEFIAVVYDSEFIAVIYNKTIEG